MADVTKISIDDCFLVASSGYMMGPSADNHFYYGGPTEEGRKAAKAAAQTEADERKAAFPSLHFTVYDLSDYMYEIKDWARHEGRSEGEGW